VETEQRQSAITVSRTVVLRVAEALDEVGIQHLERILDDLIDGQGVANLLIDLSDCCVGECRLSQVLADARERVQRAGGVLELRAPADAPRDFVELADNIPTFMLVGGDADRPTGP
jgi:anti-anti-sigma regulatory factor